MFELFINSLRGKRLENPSVLAAPVVASLSLVGRFFSVLDIKFKWMHITSLDQ